MPVLQKGCCCVELETWAAFVGWFGAVTVTLNMIGTLAAEAPLEDKIVYTIIGLVNVIVSVLLIKATKDKKSNLVVPWLISTVVVLIFGIIFEVIKLVVASGPPELVISFVIAIIIVMPIWLYSWLCIYSYYQLLSQQQIV